MSVTLSVFFCQFSSYSQILSSRSSQAIQSSYFFLNLSFPIYLVRFLISMPISILKKRCLNLISDNVTNQVKNLMFYLPIFFIFQNFIFQIIPRNPVKLYFQKYSQFTNLLCQISNFHDNINLKKTMP
jgi:hypothetical protein